MNELWKVWDQPQVTVLFSATVSRALVENIINQR